MIKSDINFPTAFKTDKRVTCDRKKFFILEAILAVLVNEDEYVSNIVRLTAHHIALFPLKQVLVRALH